MRKGRAAVLTYALTAAVILSAAVPAAAEPLTEAPGYEVEAAGYEAEAAQDAADMPEVIEVTEGQGLPVYGYHGGDEAFVQTMCDYITSKRDMYLLEGVEVSIPVIHIATTVHLAGEDLVYGTFSLFNMGVDEEMNILTCISGGTYTGVCAVKHGEVYGTYSIDESMTRMVGDDDRDPSLEEICGMQESYDPQILVDEVRSMIADSYRMEAEEKKTFRFYVRDNELPFDGYYIGGDSVIEFDEENDGSDSSQSGASTLMNIAGSYYDKISSRAGMVIGIVGTNKVRVTIDWGSSSSSNSEWVFTGVYDTVNNAIAYSDCTMTDQLYDDAGNRTDTVIYENGSGWLEFREDGSISWFDDQGEPGENAVFVKY